MSKSLRNRKEQYGVFISPVCYFSNKKDKRIANRRFRRLSKQDAHISTIRIEDCFKRHSMREVSDPWSLTLMVYVIIEVLMNDHYMIMSHIVKKI